MTAFPFLRLTGAIGIFAATLMFAADCIFMDASSSGMEFGSIWLSRLIESPNWRLTLGGIGGPIAACFFVIGFSHVYMALRPGGTFLAFLCAAGFSSGYIILGAWHSVGPMLAFIHRLQRDAGAQEVIDSGVYMQNLGLVGVVPIVCSLILLPILILSRTSLYPKWFAIVNPGLINAVVMFLFAFVPAPLGGFLVIGSGSLSFLLFFICSAIVLWNRGEKAPLASGKAPLQHVEATV